MKTMLSMIDYKHGDVILVNIPFSGSTGEKKRPAVVLSTEPFNTAGVKLIVVAITSNLSPPFRPGDSLLKDWKASGLLKPSAVRGVLATVDKIDIISRLGELSPDDLSTVEKNIANILGFQPVRHRKIEEEQ